MYRKYSTRYKSRACLTLVLIQRYFGLRAKNEQKSSYPEYRFHQPHKRNC
jgi:hypothetical protein